MSASDLRVDGHPSADELAAALIVLTSRRDVEEGPADGRTGFAAGWRAGRRAALRASEPTEPTERAAAGPGRRHRTPLS